MEKIKNLIEYGFYLYIFLLPWQTRLIWQDASLNGFTWEYGRLSLYGTEILLWVVLLLYGYWLLSNKKLRQISLSQLKTSFHQPSVRIYWLIVLLSFVAGAGVLGALNINLAYYNWFILVEALAVLSMVLVFNFSLPKIAIAFVASGLVQGLFAIWQFFVQFVPASKWFGLAAHLSGTPGSIILQTDSERWLRAYGSFPHPNMLGGFLIISLLLLLYLGFLAKTKIQRLLVLFSFIVIVPALFFTFSRSAWVGIILSLVFLAIWLLKYKHYLWQNKFFKMLFIILTLLIILGVNFIQPLIVRLTGQVPLEVSSIELRLVFTDQALELFKSNPIMGTGIGNYTLGVYEQINSSWPGYYYQAVHNIYFLSLAELGIVGAVTFYLIIISLVWYLPRAASSLDKTVLFLSFWSLLVIGLFDHYLWTGYFGTILFWLILGLNLKFLRNTTT